MGSSNKGKRISMPSLISCRRSTLSQRTWQLKSRMAARNSTNLMTRWAMQRRKLTTQGRNSTQRRDTKRRTRSAFAVSSGLSYVLWVFLQSFSGKRSSRIQALVIPTINSNNERVHFKRHKPLMAPSSLYEWKSK